MRDHLRRIGPGGGTASDEHFSQRSALDVMAGPSVMLRELRSTQSERDQMTVSNISHYRGGTIDVVTPVARKLKAAYLKHGITYRLSRFETGPNAGDWLVVVQYDQGAEEKLQAAIAQDPECQQAFAEIAKFAKRISQEKVLDLDL
jgi:hypothetical protein